MTPRRPRRWRRADATLTPGARCSIVVCARGAVELPPPARDLATRARAEMAGAYLTRISLGTNPPGRVAPAAGVPIVASATKQTARLGSRRTALRREHERRPC